MTTLPMPLLTRITGSLLMAVGLLGFLYSFAITAFIPLFIGVPLLGCGLIGRDGDLRRHFMHAAAMLSLMGVLGGVIALLTPEKLPEKEVPAAKNGENGKPAPSKTDTENKKEPFDWHHKVMTVKVATISKTLMSVLCAQHLALCVTSFILAGRARRKDEANALLAESTTEQDEEKPDEEKPDEEKPDEEKPDEGKPKEKESNMKDSSSADDDGDSAKA